jgi:hypothetical protein
MLDALAHVIKTKLNIKEDVNLLATPEPITNEKKTKKVKQAKKK